MQGHWLDARERTADMFAGEHYDILFTQDSFRMRIDQWSDIVSVDTCPTYGYKQYVKGYFIFNDNVVELHGIYTDSLFISKTMGCYNVGSYRHYFKTQKKCEHLTLNEKGNLAPNMIIELEQYP